MKNIFLPYVAVAALLLPAVAHAQIIGVQFAPYTDLYGPNGYTGGTQNYNAGVSSSAAGDLYLTNWNSIDTYGGTRDGGLEQGGDGSIVGTGLMTSTGSIDNDFAFSVNYLYSDNTGQTAANFPLPDGGNHFPFYSNTGNGNYLLAAGGISAGPSGTPIDLALDGLSTTDHYSLVVYVSGLYFQNPQPGSFSVDGQTL